MWVTGTFDFTGDALIKYRVCITRHVSVRLFRFVSENRVTVRGENNRRDRLSVLRF